MTAARHAGPKFEPQVESAGPTAGTRFAWSQAATLAAADGV
jgi:hypothetical protein